MESILIKNPLIAGEFALDPNRKVLISIVAYEFPKGIPARFYIGLVPAIGLSKQLESFGIQSKIRLIDPTSIANYCNGWEKTQSQVRDIVAGFLNDQGVNFFFDEAEPISDGALEVLKELGEELVSATDDKVVDAVRRISDSGRKHGGEVGAKNSLLYMAAHPFSWLDLYHPLIWSKRHASEDWQFVNLMSRPESRFTEVRKFLCTRRPDFHGKIDPVDLYMEVCYTPCYIPLEEEPTFADLTNHGYDWCHRRYFELRGKSGNHKRVFQDFEALMSFLGIRYVKLRGKSVKQKRQK